MPLTTQQFQQLQEALLDAFSRPDLTQMVSFVLGRDLDKVAGGATTEEIVYNLIRWTERNNRTVDLVEGAVARNPGNDKLRTFADWYLPEQDAADRPDPERPVHRDAGTDPERPGSEERAAPPPSGDNHASDSEILQIIAMWPRSLVLQWRSSPWLWLSPARPHGRRPRS